MVRRGSGCSRARRRLRAARSSKAAAGSPEVASSPDGCTLGAADTNGLTSSGRCASGRLAQPRWQAAGRGDGVGMGRVRPRWAGLRGPRQTMLRPASTARRSRSDDASAGCAIASAQLVNPRILTLSRTGALPYLGRTIARTGARGQLDRFDDPLGNRHAALREALLEARILIRKRWPSTSKAAGSDPLASRRLNEDVRRRWRRTSRMDRGRRGQGRPRTRRRSGFRRYAPTTVTAFFRSSSSGDAGQTIRPGHPGREEACIRRDLGLRTAAQDRRRAPASRTPAADPGRRRGPTPRRWPSRARAPASRGRA